MDTSYSLGMCSKRSTLVTRSRENNHSSSECRPMESQESLVVSGCSCLKQSMGWPMVRENGGIVSLPQQEDSVLRRPSWNRVLRSPQQGYHGIIGVAVDDIAGGRDEVWEQAISKLKKTFHFWALGSGKGKNLQSRGRAAADGFMRVGQPACIKCSGLCARETEEGQSGDANEAEKVAVRSVLGALGYSSRESRPTCRGLSQFCKIASTGLRCQTYKKPIGWSDWPRLTQISRSCVLRRCQWWGHTCRTSASWVRDHVC